MTKLIVFDLDGTLLNTLQDLTNSVNYAMDELDLTRYSVEQVRMMVGNGVAKLMERAVTAEHADMSQQAVLLQRQYYASHSDEYTLPYLGVCDMLKILKAKGYVIAVHTNKDENAAVKLCKKHFGNLVDYVCGTTDNITKPNPVKILRLISHLGIDRDCVIYCGDSDVDIATASALGVPCISVTWGFRDAEFLSAHGAKILADRTLDVITKTDELFSII